MYLPAKWIAIALVFFQGAAFARAPADPCHTKSRQMTLAKNCYTGDMMKSADNGTHFFGATQARANGISYCFNSLVQVERKPGDTLHIHIFKDGKDGQFHSYDYAVAPEDVKKIKKEPILLTLKGLKGDCFSATGDKEICSGGILKAIGLKDTNAALTVALAKTASGQFTVTNLVFDPKELEAKKPKELDGSVMIDNNKVTEKLVQDIHHKISLAAHLKFSSMHSGATTPKKLSEISEQFRFCSLALDGFLKFQKISDPFSSEEKTTLMALTNYMNNNAADPVYSRMPASMTPAKLAHGNSK